MDISILFRELLLNNYYSLIGDVKLSEVLSFKGKQFSINGVVQITEFLILFLF